MFASLLCTRYISHCALRLILLVGLSSACSNISFASEPLCFIVLQVYSILNWRDFPCKQTLSDQPSIAVPSSKDARTYLWVTDTRSFFSKHLLILGTMLINLDNVTSTSKPISSILHVCGSWRCRQSGVITHSNGYDAVFHLHIEQINAIHIIQGWLSSRIQWLSMINFATL